VCEVPPKKSARSAGAPKPVQIDQLLPRWRPSLTRGFLDQAPGPPGTPERLRNSAQPGPNATRSRVGGQAGGRRGDIYALFTDEAGQAASGNAQGHQHRLDWQPTRSNIALRGAIRGSLQAIAEKVGALKARLNREEGHFRRRHHPVGGPRRPNQTFYYRVADLDPRHTLPTKIGNVHR
jgi:hypothetical protein